ncbi:MAG: HD domain-containing phosphohydrolase [Moraxellaceae bacterium]
MPTDKTAARILIVDDVPANIRLLERVLINEGYQIQGASSGSEALKMVANAPPDLILLDVMMPHMNGFQVTEQLKKSNLTAHIPVILVTAADDKEVHVQGLAAGAEDFLSKPIKIPELLLRVRNLLRLKENHDVLEQHRDLLERKVSERTEALHHSYRDSIYLLTQAAERRDNETGLHIRRISHYCQSLAAALGLDEDFQEQIFFASSMHDIGKIAIPDAILLKQGPLNEEEWEVMRTHTTQGAEILAGSTSSYIVMGKEIALSHHERWDGGGYPHGLVGEQIPLAARIMSVCDVYDALRSQRPYKKPSDHIKALKIMLYGDERTQPSHFDPNVLAAFSKMSSKFAQIYDAEQQLPALPHSLKNSVPHA